MQHILDAVFPEMVFAEVLWEKRNSSVNEKFDCYELCC